MTTTVSERSTLDDWHGTDVRPYAQYISCRGRVRPFALFCETITVCCNNCLICSYRYRRPAPHVMPMSVFATAVEQFDRMGGGCLSLTPAPGEVFLDPHILERLSLLRDHPSISVSTATNAVPLTSYDDNELMAIANGFRRIYFSVYGLDREEYALMAGADHYDRAVASIRRIVSLAGDPGRFAFGFRLLTQRTPEAVTAWVRETCGFDIAHGAMWGPYHNWGGEADTTTPLPYDARWKPPLAGGVQSACLWPLIGVRVRHNGDVCTCLAFGNEDARLVIGNIETHELIDIYNSSRAGRCFGLLDGVPPTCSRCNWHVPLASIRDYEYYFTDPYSGLGG
jgi:MoaA/NifB/PqqE/SkfB family radical SAM enzyme